MNKVVLEGVISSTPVIDHTSHKEKFYSFTISTKRLGDAVDTICCIISEKLLDDLKEGDRVAIKGQARSYRRKIDKSNRLLVRVFVQDIELITDLTRPDVNEVELEGFTCKEPTLRQTPTGRTIADIFIAVNREHHKSDYIPSIAWERNAKYAMKLPIGQKINVIGRLQSREYIKVIEEESIKRTTYELSISQLIKVEE